MESYLEKNMLVFRKSYNYYSKVNLCLLGLKLFLSTILVQLVVFYYLYSIPKRLEFTNVYYHYGL